MNSKIFFSYVLLMLVHQLTAQVPQALNYQAVARNTDGSIIAGQSVDVRLSILNGSPSGNLLYSENHKTATNLYGLFTLQIGKGSAISGIFKDIDWGAGSRFLKVELAIGGGSFQLQGTTQLLSVPYALYAEKSGSAGPQGPAGPSGNSILSGITNPANTIGSNGDFFLNTLTQQLFGPKTNGLWNSGISLVGQTGPQGPIGPQGLPGIQGPQGVAGPAGSSILTGTANPSNTMGANGDFYINTTSNQLFGPKTNGLWNNGTSLIGPAGPIGPAGTGTAGVNGSSILNGVVNPSSATGANGDFYINTATFQIFGPKSAGIWPAGVSLNGLPGSQGLQSLITIENFAADVSCPTGGIIINSGIDKNKNNLLDAGEVDNSKRVCFTQSNVLDKQILIPFRTGGTGIGTQGSTDPLIAAGVPKFNKNNYPLVDSIIFIANLSITAGVGPATIELYNLTDNVPIANGLLTSTKSYTDLYPNTDIFLQTGNILKDLPNREISLGVRIKSLTTGTWANCDMIYLCLYR